MTIFYDPKQPVLLNVSDELGDDNIAGVRQGALLDEKAAAVDGCENVFKKRGLVCEGRLTEHLRDGDHIFVCDRGAVLRGPQLHTIPFSKACPADPEVTDSSGLCAGMISMDKVGKRRRLAVDSWRRD